MAMASFPLTSIRSIFISIPIFLAPKDPDNHVRANLGTKGAPFALIRILRRQLHHLVPQIVHMFGLFQNTGRAHSGTQKTSFASLFSYLNSGHSYSGMHWAVINLHIRASRQASSAKDLNSKLLYKSVSAVFVNTPWPTGHGQWFYQLSSSQSAGIPDPDICIVSHGYAQRNDLKPRKPSGPTGS
jgi:hypothetical protein